MPHIHTRPVALPDLPEVLEMAHALAAHHGDTATLTLDALKRDTLGQAPWLTLLIAEAGQNIIGYAALCPLAQLQFGARGMDIHHLFVNATVRRQGVATTLINACVTVAAARDCRYLTVGTHPNNRIAAGIYPALGFSDMPPPGPRFRLSLTR